MTTTRTTLTNTGAEAEPALWCADRLLAGYETYTIGLTDQDTYALETPGGLVATLVRRNRPVRPAAVLYLHGWSDYFFQAHLADEMAALGFDFYALDLRRYGRSLRDKQLAGYIADLDDYFVELDAAVQVIRDEGHDQLVLMGHSTGGLISALYADARPGLFRALVLNSPWLEVQGSASLRAALQPMLSAAGRLAPTTALNVTDSGFYARCISAELEGRWDFDPHLKGDPAFVIRVGWISAILRGHARVEAGLAIDCPVLVATSQRSDFRRTWDESLRCADLILDVERITARAHKLGDLVLVARIKDAMHDLVLSDDEPRREVFARFAHFLRHYA